MASYETYLRIYNGTQNTMTITVSDTDNYDWDGNSRPDHNFQNVSIESYMDKKEREELNSHANSAWYTMHINFANGDSISFRNDQYDARGVQARLLCFAKRGASGRWFCWV